MKPVHQTVFGKGQGNCLAACIASILELPIDDVPNFAGIGDDNADRMWDDCRTWMAEHGRRLISIYVKNIDLKTVYIKGHECFCIVSGDSGNEPGGHHGVVGKITDGWGLVEIVHDTNPLNKGIVGNPSWIHLIV